MHDFLHNQRKKMIGITSVMLLGLAGLVVTLKKTTPGKPVQVAVENQAAGPVPQENEAVSATKQQLPAASQSNEVASVEAEKVLLSVPFIVQAPYANWKDPVFQNACEESSIVMAMGWVNGIKAISLAEANSQILDIVAFENKTFGYNADTDMADVAKIFKEYYKKPNVTLRENITLEDIKKELSDGNLVLVPAFGQALGNPNYTAPGPVAHMLVIIGYDAQAKQFITHDPGTKHGQGYRYAEKVLFNAIWEYPSGQGPLDPPTKASWPKAMIVVVKN